MNNFGPYLDATPLLNELDRRGITFGPDHSLRRQMTRIRTSRRCTTNAADQIAVRVLGIHPITLWPDDWPTE